MHRRTLNSRGTVFMPMIAGPSHLRKRLNAQESERGTGKPSERFLLDCVITSPISDNIGRGKQLLKLSLNGADVSVSTFKARNMIRTKHQVPLQYKYQNAL